MNYAPNGESGISKNTSNLGKALGIGAAIIGTPGIHNRIREPLSEYLSGTWGPVAGKWLTWGMIGVEAAVLFYLTAIVFSTVVLAAMAAYAARRM